jgi:hypothetical protein
MRQKATSDSKLQLYVAPLLRASKGPSNMNVKFYLFDTLTSRM